MEQVDKNKHFLLFENCIPVKGAKRSIICDLQRGRFDYIPNDLIELIGNFKNTKIDNVLNHYGKDNALVIEEYILFLLSKEYGFLCDEDEVSFFPELSMEWDSPRIIENAIIEVVKESNHLYKDIFKQLEDLLCQTVELRFYYTLDIIDLSKILSLLNESVIERVEIILPFSAQTTISGFEDLVSSFPRISQIIIHSCPESIQPNHHSSDWFDVIFTPQAITSNDHCGFISPDYFRIGVKSFTESKKYNNCLNRKISIDQNGDIKNCPSMLRNYGNIKNVSLHEVTEEKSFKHLWSINKGQIDICRDCEFRYICSDCRAFLEDNTNIFSKPKKCSYDPYTAKWQN